MEKVLLSACLAGWHCRYDGSSKHSPSLLEKLDSVSILPFCPEQTGGLSTPREKAYIEEGGGADVLDGLSRVLTESGKDVTEHFIRGAREALALCQSQGIRKAYLKSRSPSCGFQSISRLGKVEAGNGVTAELLHRNGIEVISIDGGV